MAISRSVAIKNATVTAVSSCGVGTAYDIGGVYAGTKLYASLHILSSSTGGLKARIQGSSSSGFGGGKFTCHVEFTSASCRLGEWSTPLTTANVTSTHRQFWRATWECTTSGESYKMLTSMSIQ
jgi:hypothetical protein